MFAQRPEVGNGGEQANREEEGQARKRPTEGDPQRKEKSEGLMVLMGKTGASSIPMPRCARSRRWWMNGWSGCVSRLVAG